MKSPFQIVVIENTKAFKSRLYAHLRWRAGKIAFHGNLMWITSACPPSENARAAVNLLKELPVDFGNKKEQALSEIYFLSDDILEDKLRPIN
jgi:hypothetical protein